jgi:hypothetical protein
MIKIIAHSFFFSIFFQYILNRKIIMLLYDFSGFDTHQYYIDCLQKKHTRHFNFKFQVSSFQR